MVKVEGEMDTKLFVRQQPGGFFSAVDREKFPSGTIWWVGSGVTGASDSAGYGRNPDAPFATLDYAIGNATASVGDTIFLLPGHSETKSVTGSLWALDVIGVKVVGLGQGADRPKFTFSHTGAACTISAASCWLENVVLACGVDSVLAPLTISAADVTLKDVEFRDAANVEFVVGVITSTAAHNLHIDGLIYNGDYATGDACTLGISLVGVDNALIENCRFDGIFSTACINFASAHCHNIHVRNSIFNNVGTALTKDVVDTVTGSTWDVDHCFDLVGGYAFSGGSGSALASGDVSALAAAIAVIDEFHDVPAANNTANAQINEVIGNKSDTTATGAVTATDTLVAYIKQLVTELQVVDEYHDVPAVNNVLNAQINEVIGQKEDAAATGAVTTTDTLVAYIKQIVTDVEAAAVSLATNAAWSVRTVKKTGLALDGGDVADVFTIAGGPIEQLGFNMLITTAVSANACTAYFQLDPELADYADTPICAAAELNAAAVGNIFSIIDCDSTVAWVKNADGTNVGRMMEIGSQFLMPGGIDFKAQNADPSTGVADVYLTYRPLSATSTVTAS